MDQVSPFLSSQVASLLTTDPERERRPTAEQLLLRLNGERDPPYLLISTSGPAADHYSGKFGLYRKTEEKDRGAHCLRAGA